ncbi:MarR family winged helix-turn-helix transcriptional regulator [Clostridium sp.]
MKETLHYLLMFDHLMVQKVLLSSVKDTGLTPGQPKILDYLLHHDGAIQKEIAIFCHIKPASLTAILNGMENKGYIERKTIDNNRRSLHVYLTEMGKKYADRLNLEFARIESDALKGFDEKDTQQLYDLLNRIYQNMINIQKKEGTDK